MNRSELAGKYFRDGYNCSQSVVLAFSDLLPIKKEILLDLSSPFGGGISRLRETCGAISGMCIVLGLLNGYHNIDNDKNKTEIYSLTQSLVKKFEDENGTIVCRELLKLDHKHDNPIPSSRNKNFYKTRPCENIIKKAAEILENYINETRNK